MRPETTTMKTTRPGQELRTTIAPAFGQESRMLGIFIPGPDLSKSGADAWAKSQVDPIEKARRKARKIEKNLTSVGKRPSDFDTRRFVRKVATAASVLEHKPVIGRTFLSDDDIPKFLQRKVNCSLTAAQVGALLDKIPDYSDPNKTSDWLLEHQPDTRVIDAVFAVNLISSLGEAHNGVTTANRIRAEVKDAALEAAMHKAARPKSAPNRVRPPVVGQCTTAFMRLLDSPSKKQEPKMSFGVAAKLLTKMKKQRPKSARGWGSRDARPSAYARDIAGWSIKAMKRPKSALPKRSAHARLNNLVAGAHIIDLGGPRRRTELPPAPQSSPIKQRDLPQKPLEAHDAGIAKLQAIALRHERHAIDRLDGCDIQDLASFIDKRFHVHLTKAEASAISGLARDGVALQATLRELATIGCRRSPRVLLSGLLAAVPLAPGANESLVALGGDLAAKASQGSGHAQDRLEKLERACAWAARRIELYPEDETIAFGLKRLQKLVRAELERRHVTKKKVKTLRKTVASKPIDKPQLKRRESTLTKLKNQLNEAQERKALQQVLSKFTENHRVREHQVFKDVQARSHRARATMNAAEFASMIHRDLASQAASAFAVAKSPVAEKDEDELHEERLHRMTRTGSPCSSGDEGSPQASPQKPVVQKVVEVKAPSNPTTPRRRRSTRSSLPTTPSQRGPFGAVATELAAEVINNCVRSFVYRCLRKKMARAQHEWKRWMEQRAHRMLARAARTWAAKARMRKRYLRVQAQIFDQSKGIIERLILRKVRKMRAIKAGLTGAAYAMAVGSIFDKDPLSEEDAAIRLQKRFRAIDARARSNTLQHAREATRCIRVEVVKARGLRVADARRLNQADHHTFIGGAADPRCYVSAQLGGRGGFGPSNAGAPEEAKERIERQYDILAKRHQALDEQHTRDDGVEKRKYLDALDKLKESGEEKKREALASRAANLSSVMDKACLLKMRRNTMPFWMPSIVRARDWGKFAAYPSRYPLFRAKTKVIAKTLDPTWNAQFDVHGVDPDSTVTFTVADVDDPTSPQSADDRDDFLGQVRTQRH